MVIELNKNPISDHTERYRAAGLSLEFLGEMAKAVSALQSAGYEPYDQLYGYAMHCNDQYITRFGGAREIVTKMDIKDIKIFLKHYKEHKWLRLKDMPDEWFEMPSNEAMKNNLVAAICVSVCNRLMDQHRFEEADAHMANILSIESGIIGLYRNLVICDRLYYELIHENRSEVVASFYTKEQQKFMKAMRTFPSLIRTEYAYALLVEKDPSKAAKAMEVFEKVAKTYPYPDDINSERELIQIAEKKASA